MNAMRRVTVTAAVLAAFAVSFAAMAAQAGFGAIAYDQYAGKEGFSWNQPSEAEANERALRQCASQDCRVYPVSPKACGALARSDKDQAWGGAERQTLDLAKREAVDRCKTHTQTGTCVVHVSGCNK
jgi:formiminotetrahydrofolate cyclodeaminase